MVYLDRWKGFGVHLWGYGIQKYKNYMYIQSPVLQIKVHSKRR
jgi:hypothetical protein